jgi:hypothetical protein
MSDESFPSCSTSPNDILNTSQHDYATTLSSSSCNTDLRQDSDPALDEGFKAQQQNDAISTMLEVCTPEGLLQLTQLFATAKDAGHHRCLEIISEIPVEQRASRIEAVSQ